jgi:ElaB/YqjD/DUF883 family membrane-anchored ribosome-binding protein
MAIRTLDYSKHTPQSGTDGARELTEGAGDRMKDMAADAQEMTGRAAEQAREYGEKAQEAVRNFKPYVERSMKEQPMTTLAVASVIGFVLGALWKK